MKLPSAVEILPVLHQAQPNCFRRLMPFEVPNWIVRAVHTHFDLILSIRFKVEVVVKFVVVRIFSDLELQIQLWAIF